MLKNAEFIQKIETSLQTKITEVEDLTTNVTLVTTIDGSQYTLKTVPPKCRDVYDFLASQKVQCVSYPVKSFRETDGAFFLYRYVKALEYPPQKKISNLFEAITELHGKTAYEKKLPQKSFKYLHRTYKKLDTIFQTLEMIIREAELATVKTDIQWILLSKYSIFLKAKAELYELQKKIHKYIDDKGTAIYCLNHGNPCLTHMVDDKIISFNHASLGIFVSDIAKLYVANEQMNLNWFRIIEEQLARYDNPFYKVYFKFFVLYIYMINLRFDDTHETEMVNIYIQIANKIKIFMTAFESYR